MEKLRNPVDTHLGKVGVEVSDKKLRLRFEELESGRSVSLRRDDLGKIRDRLDERSMKLGELTGKKANEGRGLDAEEAREHKILGKSISILGHHINQMGPGESLAVIGAVPTLELTQGRKKKFDFSPFTNLFKRFTKSGVPEGTKSKRQMSFLPKRGLEEARDAIYQVAMPHGLSLEDVKAINQERAKSVESARDVPPLYQEKDFSCGYACIRMAALKHGRVLSEMDVRSAMPGLEKVPGLPWDFETHIANELGIRADTIEFKEEGTIRLSDGTIVSDVIPDETNMKKHLDSNKNILAWINTNPETGEILDPTLKLGQRVLEHYVLVTGMDDQHIYYNEPTFGEKRKESKKKFFKSMSNGIAM